MEKSLKRFCCLSLKDIDDDGVVVDDGDALKLFAHYDNEDSTAYDNTIKILSRQ